MGATLTEHQQFVDSGGRPVVGGFVYYGIRGSDPVPEENHIAIFSDRDLSVPLANPQPTDANGRTNNKVWLAGSYSLKLEDKNNAQLYENLDNGTITDIPITLAVLRVATTGNVDINTDLVAGDLIDGVTLVAGDDVLVKEQTNPAENGVYVASSGGAALRAADFSAYDDYPGAYFSVMEGTANADKLFRCTSNRGGVLDVTAITITGDLKIDSLSVIGNIVANGNITGSAVTAISDLVGQRAIVDSVHMPEGPPPDTDPSFGATYTKDSGGQPELFYREENNGDEVQITSDGVLNNTDGRLKSVQVFPTSGTWTKPAGINLIRIQLVGGGAGGGGGTGGAGGSGGYAESLIDASALTAETVTIGGGGNGGAGGFDNGANGQTTSFGAFATAGGGSGGGSGAFGGGDGGGGGSGTGGDINVVGGHGTTGVSSGPGGTGGASYYGGGGNGPGSGSGNMGEAFGSGGGGAGSTSGGNGAPGFIVVWEYS